MSDPEVAAKEGSSSGLRAEAEEVLGSLPEGASAAEIVRRLLAKIKELQSKLAGGESSEGEDTKVASSIRAQLALPNDAGVDAVTLALSLQAGRHDIAEAARLSEDRIQHYVNAQVLNRFDEPQMHAARKLAYESPEQFESLMAHAAPLVPTGATKPPPGGKVRVAGRRQVIVVASQKFADDPLLQRDTSREAFVNCSLREAGHEKLADGELLLIG